MIEAHNGFQGKRLWTALLVIGVFALSACGRQETTSTIDLNDTVAEADMTAEPLAPDEFRFSFDLRTSPQEDSRQYQPFLDYLAQATGYKFRLHFVRKDQTMAEQIANGAVQFASVGAVSSIQAQLSAGATPLARGINKEGKASYRAMIVVAPNSPIKSLADLRGKRMAFGSINSTQGHLIPRIMLKEAGLDLQDLASYDYTGSHQNCANAVISGKADACGMQDTLAITLADGKQLNILKTSREYPSSGIIASPDVAAAILGKVRQALIDFAPQGRDAHNLYHWDKTEMPHGFVGAGPNDYAELRANMVRFKMMPELKPK